MTGDDVNKMLGLLDDPDMVTWTEAERIVYINAGVRDICTHKPKASTVTQNLLLAAGATRQAVPADCIAVLDLACNMGADGATPGRHITTTTADRLGAVVPGWRRDTGAAVKHLVMDDRDSGSYYVWPAPTAAVHVEALVHKLPAAIAALSEALPLNDSYLNALTEYVLHMAYAKDAENPGYVELSIAHYGKYASTLGIQVAKQKRASAPANSPESPVHPAVDKNGA